MWVCVCVCARTYICACMSYLCLCAYLGLGMFVYLLCVCLCVCARMHALCVCMRSCLPACMKQTPPLISFVTESDLPIRETREEPNGRIEFRRAIRPQSRVNLWVLETQGNSPFSLGRGVADFWTGNFKSLVRQFGFFDNWIRLKLDSWLSGIAWESLLFHCGYYYCYQRYYSCYYCYY